MNLNDDVIRMIQFEQTNQDALSDGNAPTKRLNSVVITDQGNTSPEKYRFEYYPTVYSNSSVVDVRFRDLWGYYNSSGQLMMRPVVENIPCGNLVGTDYITIGDAASIRTPSLPGTTSGVLRKIIFPTGGSKEFVYEQNKYWDDASSQVKVCGGLRLSESITKDGAGNTTYKTYKYGLAESGYGILPFVPKLSNMFFETKHLSYYQETQIYGDINYRERTYHADVLPIFGEFLAKPVYYEEVTEYHGTVTSNVGKTIYKYDKGNLFAAPNSVQGLFANSDLKHWKENSLIEKTDFKRESSSYIPVRKVTNTHQETVYPEEKVWGLHVGKVFVKSPLDVFDPTIGQWVPSYRYLSTACSPDNLDVFQFADYTISIGKKELTQTVDSMFFDNGATLATVTDYIYNVNHLVSTTSVIASNGDTLVTEYKYPFDVFQNTVYSEMINRNMLNYNVEENKYRNNLLLSSLETQYGNWGNNIIKPDTVSLKKGTNPYEPRVVFHSYDESGNIQCVSKDGGPKISYQYAHRDELPIAQITNASPNQIFYTSFEEMEGNSTDGDAKTGIKSRIGGYSKALTGLTNGDYKLTYFQKSSGVWNLVQLNNIMVSSGTYSINITGQVDEIRFFPNGSFVKTYAYAPLQGVTSVTDENNRTSYYRYDELNRLSTIKDDQGNILKRYTYHYKIQ